MAQKQQIHLLIATVQKDLDEGVRPSSFQLFLLCSAYYEVRNYDKALEAIAILEKQIERGDRYMFAGGDLAPYTKILRSQIALDLGEIDEAIRLGEDAIASLTENLTYRSQLLACAGALGVANALKGDDTKAAYFQSLLETLPDSGSVANTDRQIAIAKVQVARKRFDGALLSLRHPSMQIQDATRLFYDDTFQRLPALFLTAHCEFELGDFASARRDYEHLLRHPYIEQIGSLHWQVLFELAQVERREGKTNAAISLLEKAVDVLERHRASIASEAGRIGFVGDKQAVYQELVDLLCSKNQAAKAFEYVERSKSRALVDLLAEEKNLAPKREDLQQTWKRLQIEDKNRSTIVDPVSASVENQTRGISVNLRKSLAAEAPEFASLVSVVPFGAAELQDLLQPGQTILEYYETSSHWLAFIVTCKSVKSVRLNVTRLKDDIHQLRRALSKPESGDYLPSARRLYNELMAPLAGEIAGESLTVIPHGILHYIPFAVLHDGERFVLDMYALNSLPSASIIKYLAGREEGTSRKVLSVGNPDLGDQRLSLQYAEEEAITVAKTFPKSMLLLHDKARASFVESHGSEYDILHFALHGKFNPDVPLDSALLFTREGKNDGLLKASDLYALHLDAELVTLSACETALGKVMKGDDVIGFTRGFFYAGARAVLSSLWMVDDLATRDLMVEFYRNLDVRQKAEALRHAQLFVKDKYAHPYYWAAFQLSGI